VATHRVVARVIGRTAGAPSSSAARSASGSGSLVSVRPSTRRRNRFDRRDHLFVAAILNSVRR